MDLSSPSKPKEKTEQQGRDDIHNFSVKEVHSNHYNYHLERDVHPRHRRSRIVENVLVLQGGGSLGAFGCGVYKALARQGKRFDIVAGTSIGAVNAAIIAGSRSDHPERDLEDFWMELAESSYDIIPDVILPQYDFATGQFAWRRIRAAAINAGLFGVPKMFIPRMWSWTQFFGTSNGFSVDEGLAMTPEEWTYLYDHTPLGKTLEKYVDFDKLSVQRQHPEADGQTRLILTSVDVLTSKHLVYDSYKTRIEAKHILASTAYPNYGFPWVEIEQDVFGWDGALLDNTPLREVIEASPRNDKHVYIVENYPRVRRRLPQNRVEVSDRARDITFSDKTTYDIETAKRMTRIIELVEHIYDAFEKHTNMSKLNREEIDHIKKDYHELVETGGAEILSVNRIVRTEMDSPYPLKNADFSLRAVTELIQQGEENADQVLSVI
ncbi:MAG: patatin-like phospholipase family protein [Nitrososphaera sp.]|jgi:NTE family protein